MRVSSRVDYGVRALFDLAQHPGPNPIQSREIAQRQGIPEAYLHQLLGALSRGGLVRSTRGPQGGHRLTREPEAITLHDVWVLLEGRDRRSNTEAAPRHDAIADTWTSIHAAFEDQLRAVTLQTLIDRAGASRSDYSI
ncbi:MAG TPA: Rrf2 family transcriptional regulator [Thermomicrobiales bacterium]|jgi:Rrf2 family protein|nr:Rrf2 family transcriptional regulator [Thermomicrobiales bacterium]